MPAAVQITAEQLLREAKERELELQQPVSINITHMCSVLPSEMVQLSLVGMKMLHITDALFQPPKQKISDPDELASYRLRKRKGFEDNIRKNRSVITNWLKYAGWEESQQEIQRYVKFGYTYLKYTIAFKYAHGFFFLLHL